jgi:formylglycine-generating enzyme required for sulfatase activity
VGPADALAEGHDFESGPSPSDGGAYDGAYDGGVADGSHDSGDGDGSLSLALDWVAIPGGRFEMGSTRYDDEQPVHEVTVSSFEMLHTEVTVAQYTACVTAAACSEPWAYHANCNWTGPGIEDYPINCISWVQSRDFCYWAGGRLPTEAEWEYAARSGGQPITYPWGNDEPSCFFAVMNDNGWGCGLNRTWEVCSKLPGNTTQGLCDMAGNVWEWVRDWYHDSYVDAPNDGSAWEDPAGTKRVIRGGRFYDTGDYLRAANRIGDHPSVQHPALGFRCVRDP